MLIYIGNGMCLQFVVVVTGVEVCCCYKQQRLQILPCSCFFLFDLGLPFELPLKEAMSLVALPAETHYYYWRPVSMVVGYLCLIKFQIGVHNGPVYLAFTNMSIPLLEAEIFPLPSILFPSCSRYLSVFSFSILEASCSAECL